MKQYKDILLNREDAARALKEVIPFEKFKDEKWDLVAVSKGGLLLASYLKSKYTKSLNILFLEPIMAPNNPECEVARVSETEEIVIQENLIESFDIKLDYIYGEARRKHEEGILSNIYKFRKGRAFPSMKGNVVLLIDDGSETGTKLMTAIKTVLSQSPKAVYIAVPIIPTDVLETLDTFVDNIFFLYDIEDYVETELYYKKLEEISDSTIEKILEENR